MSLSDSPYGIAFTVSLVFWTVSFIVGVVLLSLFVVPYQCPNMDVLIPGGQGSCNRTDGDYYKAEITSSNGTSSLTTYVFDKEPKRIYVDEKFVHSIKSSTLRIDMPMVEGAVYKWSISVNKDTDIYFRSPKHGKTSGTIYYKQKNVKSSSGEYTAESSRSDTYFYLSTSSSASGTFTLTVTWPRWDVVSTKPVDTCRGTECKWIFSEQTWGETENLWIVTVNNGTKPYEVSMELSNNLAVCLTVSLILMIVPTLVLVFFCFFLDFQHFCFHECFQSCQLSRCWS